MANPTPLILSTNLETRDGTSATKDARITNMLVEPKKDGTHFIKRPGYSIYDGTGWASAPGLGATTLPNGTIIAFNGTLGSANNTTVNISSGTFTTFDPLAKSARITLALGNLIATTDATNNNALVKATIYKSAGLLYCEFPIIATSGPNGSAVGICDSTQSVDSYPGDVTLHGWGYFNAAIKNPGNAAYGASWGTGDVISMLWDATAQTLTFWKNGISQGTAFTSVTGTLTPCVRGFASPAVIITGRFIPSAFAYTPPAGYTGWTT